MLMEKHKNFLLPERVARIGTIDFSSNSIHIVPVCFAFDGEDIYTSLYSGSKRLRNIEQGSRVSLLIDKYLEEKDEWKILSGILIYGDVKILNYVENREEFMYGWKLLIQKYPQYKHWANPDLSPKDPEKRRIMKISPKKIISWGFS